MTPRPQWTSVVAAVLLLGIAALPATAVDYTVSGTVMQDPDDPTQLGINGADFDFEASVGGSPVSLTTTSTDSEATYNADSMQFSLNNDPPAMCMGTPTLTLLDNVSGSDVVSFDDCDVDFSGLPATLNGTFTIPGGNMATSAPADITSSDATGVLRLRLFGPENTFVFNFVMSDGTLSASGAEPPSVTIMPSSVSLMAAHGSLTPVSQVVSFSASQAVSYAVSTSGESWLDVTPLAGNTSSTITVSLDPTGLAPGVHNGSVMLSYGSQAEDSIAVAFEILPTLSLNPSPLIFSYQQAEALPASQQINVTSAAAITIDNVTVSTTGGGPWLAADPAGGATPLAVTVSVNPTGLSPGMYSGMVTVVSADAVNSPQEVPVKLTVIPAPFMVSPTQLSFIHQTGTAGPASQPIDVSSAVATDFTVSVFGDWLSVSPDSATTPQTVTVSVDPTGLTPTTYFGNVTISSLPGGPAPHIINVSLTVSDTAPLSLTAAPGSLSFTYYVNGEVPNAKRVNLSAPEALDFTVAASGGNWLDVSPADGMTPADLTVAVDPLLLDPGEYLGEITVTAEAAANTPVVIPVALTVILAPVFTSESVLNGAGFQLGQPPASGGLATVFGFFPGVTDEGAAEVPLPDSLQDVSIRIRSLVSALSEAKGDQDNDGDQDSEPTLAPLLFVSNGQINFQLPWEIPAGPAEMVITANGMESVPVEVLLSEVNPGVFTFDFGPGRAVAFLPSGIVAQPVGSIAGVTCRPVRAGEVLVILATGLGPLTGPPLASGDNSLDEQGAYVRRDTVFPVRVFIGGQEAEVVFSGASPQFVGVNQINVVVPDGIEPGVEVTLVIEVNELQSRTDVTIAVDPAQ